MSRTNALVITDVSSNIRRIVTILQVADEGRKIPTKDSHLPARFLQMPTESHKRSQTFFREEGGRDDRQSDSGATRMTCRRGESRS